MNRDLLQAARAFLGEDTRPWISTTSGFVDRIVRYISGTHGVAIQALEPIAETLLSALSDPSVVAGVAATSTDEEGVLFLSGAVFRSLPKTPVETGAHFESYLDDIVDISGVHWKDSSTSRIARRSEGDWDDIHDLPEIGFPMRGRLLSERFTDELEVSLYDIASLLRLHLDSSQEVSSSPIRGNLFSLSSFDLALYEAIREHPKLLKSLNWRVFEQLLGDVLSKFGYEVDLQRGTKDGGVDIFAIARESPFGPQRYILQAKRWNNRVGVAPVRELLFLQDRYRATKCCLATTSLFTGGAWQLAEQYKWQLALRDFQGIRDWIEEASRIARNQTSAR